MSVNSLLTPQEARTRKHLRGSKYGHANKRGVSAQNCADTPLLFA